jgi:hypothetical protein
MMFFVYAITTGLGHEPAVMTQYPAGSWLKSTAMTPISLPVHPITVGFSHKLALMCRQALSLLVCKKPVTFSLEI